MRNVLSSILVLVFCLSIMLPLVITALTEDQSISWVEKRKLNSMPRMPVNWQQWQNFPAAFAAYYADQFGLREYLVAGFKLFKFKLGDSPADNVTIGKNGWLFLGSIKTGFEKYSDPMGDARNVNLYTEQQLKTFAAHLTTLQNRLHQHGIQYLLVIAPNKHTIYSEHLPGYIDKAMPYSATDQLTDHLKKHTQVNFIDLRQALLKVKDRFQLYYKNDSHWNFYGANYAQFSIMSKIGELLPDASEAELFAMQEHYRDNGDLSNSMGVTMLHDYDPLPDLNNTCASHRIPEQAVGLQPYTWVCDTGKLSAVIFRDSFFNALETFFIRKFKRSRFIWGHLNYPDLIAAVKIAQPDIVIEQMVERKLPYVRSD